MLRNASVGEFIFFQQPVFDMETGQQHARKAHTRIVSKVGLRSGERDGPIIKEDQLNSLGRFICEVWTEKELACHEIEYMKQNSIGRNYV